MNFLIYRRVYIRVVYTRLDICTDYIYLCEPLFEVLQYIKYLSFGNNFHSSCVILICLNKNFPFIPFSIPENLYLFKVNKRITRKKWEICLKLTINTPERRHWCWSGVFIVNFELIPQLLYLYCWLFSSKDLHSFLALGNNKPFSLLFLR